MARLAGSGAVKWFRVEGSSASLLATTSMLPSSVAGDEWAVGDGLGEDVGGILGGVLGEGLDEDLGEGFSEDLSGGFSEELGWSGRCDCGSLVWICCCFRNFQLG
jgi:hypothetical protein